MTEGIIYLVSWALCSYVLIMCASHPMVLVGGISERGYDRLKDNDYKIAPYYKRKCVALDTVVVPGSAFAGVAASIIMGCIYLSDHGWTSAATLVSCVAVTNGLLILLTYQRGVRITATKVLMEKYKLSFEKAWAMSEIDLESGPIAAAIAWCTVPFISVIGPTLMYYRMCNNKVTQRDVTKMVARRLTGGDK